MMAAARACAWLAALCALASSCGRPAAEPLPAARLAEALAGRAGIERVRDDRLGQDVYSEGLAHTPVRHAIHIPDDRTWVAHRLSVAGETLLTLTRGQLDPPWPDGGHGVRCVIAAPAAGPPPERLRHRIHVIDDGSATPVIEVRSDSWGRDDWDLVAVLAADETGIYRLYAADDARWLAWRTPRR